MSVTDEQAVMGPGARDLSPQEREQWAEQAHAIEQRVKEGFARGRMALIDTAEALYEFNDTQGWLALGYDTLNDWLADPEISMTGRTYRRLVRTWRELAVVRRVPRPTLANVDASKLDIVLPAIEQGKVTVEEALGDAKGLGARELRDRYFGPPAPPQAPPDTQDDDARGEAVIVQDDAPVTADNVVLDDVQAVDDGVSDDEPQPGEATEYVYPTEDEWADMQKRAKRRKRPLKQYAQWVGHWTLIDPESDGKDRLHWATKVTYPQPDVQVVATSSEQHAASPELILMAWREVMSAIDSGQSHPRVDVEALRVLLATYGGE